MFPYEVLASRKDSSASEAEYETRANELLKMAGLEEFKDAYPKQLSGVCSNGCRYAEHSSTIPSCCSWMNRSARLTSSRASL